MTSNNETYRTLTKEELGKAHSGLTIVTVKETLR